MKKRAELIKEYEALIKMQVPEPFTFHERSAVVNCLQWVIWGNGEAPTQWFKNPAIEQKEASDAPRSRPSSTISSTEPKGSK